MTSDKIRKLRQRLGLTQRELADRLSTTETTISRWERGEAVPRSLFHRRELERLKNRAADFDN